MATYKVLKNFSASAFSDPELIVKVRHIVEEMTNNPSFPEPTPELAVITTGVDAFSELVQKVEDGSRADTALKNQQREVLVALLKKLALYVETASGGDGPVILSSGFDINKQPASVGPLEKPTSVVIKMGDNPGSVQLSCGVVKNAQFYEFEYLEAPKTENSIWIKRTSTKHKMQIEGLTSGKQYIFRIAAAGSDPARNYSNEVAVFVS